MTNAAPPTIDPVVQAQYEAYPYPTRKVEDEQKRLIQGSPSAIAELEHYLYGGKLPQRLRVLSAGGGTGDAAIMMAQQGRDRGLDIEVVHLDLSSASQAIAKARAELRGLTDIMTFVQDSLLNAAKYGPFDYIDCCGVLHHLQDPPAGLQALRAALKPDAAGLGIMVYAPYGRLGVYQAQSAFRRVMGPDMTPQEKVALGKKLYQQLPAFHHFKMNKLLNDHQVSDAGFYDLLLHSTDRAYTVDQLVEFAATADMEIVSFIEKTKYDPATYVPEIDRVATTPTTHVARAALAEELSTSIFKHIFYLVPRGQGREMQNGPEAVPFYHNFEGQQIGRKIKPGDPIVGALQGLSVSLIMPRLTPLVMQRIDGVKSWTDIHADLQQQLGGDAPTWENFWTQAQEIWHKLHGLNVLLLRQAEKK